MTMPDETMRALPPLPKGDVAADTCPVMWVHSDDAMRAYATAAVLADRGSRASAAPAGEPVAWVSDHDLERLRADKWAAVTAVAYKTQGGCAPLYTAPPSDAGQRAPLKPRQVSAGFSTNPLQSESYAKWFKAGVRFAEEHHGIRAATRRAIVRAAAALGERKEG